MRRMRAVYPLAGLVLFLTPAGAATSQTRGIVAVRLVNSMSTENSQPGDTFTATLAEPLVVSGRVVAQKNARVTGQVREVVSSGRLKRPALITLSLHSVQSHSRSYPIATGDLTIKADSHATRNLVIIGGSTGAGAVIGGATGGGKGAAIGAATGAGVGTLAAFLTGKREIELPSETLLTFQVNSVTISPKELAQLQRVGETAPSVQTASSPYEERDSYSSVARRRDRRSDEDDGDYEDGTGQKLGKGVQPTEIIFTRDERILITDWFRRYHSDLPPGLAKRDRLPPGLEKQLRERGTLPPGLQKRVQPLPWELERRLRRLPRGYRRFIIGRNVILMDEGTAVIYEIIRNVIP